ncbi:MAG: hypothetical protein QM790_16395 [Nibricoccus sp.]
MDQATVIYLTNIVIITILGCMISQYWLRQGRAPAMFFWMLSAWILVVADVFFALRSRPELPYWVGRIIPTGLVTVGHACLLMGARKTANIDNGRWWLIPAVVGGHVLTLVYFLFNNEHTEWRMVVNGVVWAGFSFASCWSLRQGAKPFSASLFSPCKAFMLHGGFHCFRFVFASVCAVQHWDNAAEWLQTISDFEVSFFMVALFVGLLTANLHLRNEELSNALAEVQTLTGLLPICAWCRKVRNDDGYWQKVEDYLAARSGIKFTHGICTDCFNQHRPQKRECKSS